MSGELVDQNHERAVQAMLQQLGASADVYVLAAAARDYRFWKRWSEVICIETPKLTLEVGRPKPKMHCDDFAFPPDNAIYVAIYQVHMGNAAHLRLEEKDMPGASQTLVLSALQSMVKRGVAISEAELPVALQRLQQIYDPGVPADFLQVAERIAKAWIQGRRQQRLQAKLSSSRIGLDKVREEINAVTQQIAMGETTDTSEQMAINLEGKIVEILPAYSAVSPGISKVMGGGFRKKEATLMIAAQAVGKTIHFAQCGFDLFNAHRLKVLAISTEQEPAEVELRNISRECNIPFNKLADGFDASRLAPDELTAYRNYIAGAQRLRANGGELRMLKWKKGDMGLHAKLNDLIKLYGDTMNGIDVIMLDWIGGGVELTTAAAANYRFYMQMLADAFCEAVRTHKLIGIAYAQARAIKAEGYDNWMVKSENLQENKSLGNNFTNIIGMSGMRVRDEGGNTPGAQVAFEVQQNYYISKARKGTGGSVRFSRAKYHFQRLIDMA